MTPDEASALIASVKSSYARTGLVRTADALDLADGYAAALAEIDRLRSELDADRLHESAEAFAARMSDR